MQRALDDPHGDECDCERTRVDYQVLSAMVMTPRYSETELTVNIFDVDDAKWRQVATMHLNDDLEDWIDAARAALNDENAPCVEACESPEL